MKSKNIVFVSLLLLIFFNSVASIQESNYDDYIHSFEELQDLMNTPRFAEYMEERERDEVELQGLFSGEECLMPKSDAINTLKNSYGVSNSNPDNNLRFILGKSENAIRCY